MNDPYDLRRFLWAQEGVIESVLDELKQGHKTAHWMWFIFPQVAGLGHSATAHKYAISSIDEARAYLDDPVLGARLETCCRLLLEHTDKSALQILGSIDALKLRSCMTLFDVVSADGPFSQVLDCFYGGVADDATLEILGCRDR